MKTRVHISLDVADIASSVAFYEKIFQRKPTKILPDYANFRMENPNLHLALNHVPGKKQETEESGRHYGIELFSTDELSKWLNVANNSGLETQTEEKITCCYALADKFWARDPDGHRWEFWVRHEEASLMHGEACASPLKTACCPTQNETGS